jgi:hypothetical protein
LSSVGSRGIHTGGYVDHSGSGLKDVETIQKIGKNAITTAITRAIDFATAKLYR